MTEWNDDRLDELNERVKEGFAEVDKRFAEVDKRFDKVDERFVRLEGEIKKRFDKNDERFATREEMGEVRAELRHLGQRFDRLLNVLVAISLGFAGTVLAATIGLIAVVLL